MSDPTTLEDPRIIALRPQLAALIDACREHDYPAVVQIGLDDSNAVQAVFLGDPERLSPDIAIAMLAIKGDYARIIELCRMQLDDPGIITDRQLGPSTHH